MRFKIRQCVFALTISLIILNACQSPKPQSVSINQYAYQLMRALNQHQTDSLSLLLGDKIRFQDAQNRVLENKSRVTQGWKKYWELFPDYHIEIETIFVEQNKLAVFGISSATYKNRQSESHENQWNLPLAWLLEIEQGKITNWKMYSDTKVIYEIIRSNEE